MKLIIFVFIIILVIINLWTKEVVLFVILSTVKLIKVSLLRGSQLLSSMMPADFLKSHERLSSPVTVSS